MKLLFLPVLPLPLVHELPPKELRALYTEQDEFIAKKITDPAFPFPSPGSKKLAQWMEKSHLSVQEINDLSQILTEDFAADIGFTNRSGLEKYWQSIPTLVSF